MSGRHGPWPSVSPPPTLLAGEALESGPQCKRTCLTGPMDQPELVELEVDAAIWDQVHTVAPLVLVGTKEGDGYDIAPKHLAMPIGWTEYFVFVCTPEHHTYTNIVAHPEFTVSYPRPDSVVLVGQAAAERHDGEKLTLEVLPTFAASVVDGVHVADSYLHLECRLEQMVDGFGSRSLIIGRVVRAACDPAAVRSAPDVDDAALLHRSPLLAFVAPNRFATISDTDSFPFPRGMRR